MTGRTRPREGEDWLIRTLFALFLLAGAAVRFWRFGSVPEGLNQDERSEEHTSELQSQR